MRGLLGRYRLARRNPPGALLQGRDGAPLRAEDEGFSRHRRTSSSPAVVRTGRRCANTWRRCCTGSARGWIISRSCSSRSARSISKIRLRRPVPISRRSEGTSWPRCSRVTISRKSRHRNGAGDIGEEDSIRPRGIDAIHLGQRGRVVRAGGFDPAGETERAALNRRERTQGLTPAKRRAISERMRKYWAARRA